MRESGPFMTATATGTTGATTTPAATPATTTTASSKTLPHHPWEFLTSYGIKWIAIVTMIIDHVAAILVWDQYIVLRSTAGASADALTCYNIYLVMRYIGRIAFPLFCFLLVEGFVHTRSRAKYVGRMFVFALISEWPYDFALYGTGIEFVEHQNVMFTLLLGFLTLWGGDELGKRLEGLGLPKGGTTVVVTILLVLAGAYVADVLELSYHAFGILLIGGFYLGRRWRLLQVAIGALLIAWYCWDHNWNTFQYYSVISLLFIFLYNGQRGRSMKWFFYAFYPCHLLLLGLLEIWMF